MFFYSKTLGSNTMYILQTGKSLLALVSLLCATNAFALTSADMLAQGATPLTEEDIKSVSQNQTLDHKMLGTRLVAPIYYGTNGTRIVNATAFGGRIYNTKWWTESGKRCEISAKNNTTQCGLVFKREKDYLVCFEQEEQCAWTFTVRPGNPDKLGE